MKIKGKTEISAIPKDLENIKIGIVKAQWNSAVTDTMLSECTKALKNAGILEENIISKNVPGSYELPLGALFIENTHNPAAVICLGCVIKGETDHDIFINQGIAQGIMGLNLRFSKPFVFGVLTVNSEEQAIARADGSKENKGKEAAEAALEMILLRQDLKKEVQGQIGFRNR